MISDACRALIERAESINWESPDADGHAEDVVAAWSEEYRRGGDPEKFAIGKIVTALHEKFPEEMIGKAIEVYLHAADDRAAQRLRLDERKPNRKGR